MIRHHLMALALLAAIAAPLAAEPAGATPASATAEAGLIDAIKAADDFAATWELTGDGRNATGTFAWQRPGKVRVETGAMSLVSDGATCLLIMNDSKSYLGGPVDWPVAGGGLRSGELPFFANAMLKPQAVLDLLHRVEASNATFAVDGDALTATLPPTKEGEEGVRIRYTGITLGKAPADAEFFSAKGPADYRDVTGLSAKPSFRAFDLVEKTAPPLGGIPHGGQMRALSELRGNVVVVDFWASWCAPCVQSMPEYAKLARELAGEPVVFVGVNMDEEATLAQARAFSREKGIDFPLIFGKHDIVAKNWNIQSLPTLFVVRPDGIVHFAHVGLLGPEDNLRDLIAEARKATPAGPQPLPSPAP